MANNYDEEITEETVLKYLNRANSFLCTYTGGGTPSLPAGHLKGICKLALSALPLRLKKRRNQVRVHVHSGDGKTDLGEGRYVGDVKVYCFLHKSDMHIRSMHDAESPPSEELIETLKKEGFIYQEIGQNPKIVLDSGDTVYGCQVWWEPIKKEKKEKETNGG